MVLVTKNEKKKEGKKNPSNNRWLNAYAIEPAGNFSTWPALPPARLNNRLGIQFCIVTTFPLSPPPYSLPALHLHPFIRAPFSMHIRTQLCTFRGGCISHVLGSKQWVLFQPHHYCAFARISIRVIRRPLSAISDLVSLRIVLDRLVIAFLCCIGISRIHRGSRSGIN